jgi:hypothetical protein
MKVVCWSMDVFGTDRDVSFLLCEIGKCPSWVGVAGGAEPLWNTNIKSNNSQFSWPESKWLIELVDLDRERELWIFFQIQDLVGLYENSAVSRLKLCSRRFIFITPSHWHVISKDPLNSLESTQPSYSSRSVQATQNIFHCQLRGAPLLPGWDKAIEAKRPTQSLAPTAWFEPGSDFTTASQRPEPHTHTAGCPILTLRLFSLQSVASFNALTKSDSIQRISRPFPSKNRFPPTSIPWAPNCHRAVLLSVWT